MALQIQSPEWTFGMLKKTRVDSSVYKVYSAKVLNGLCTWFIPIMSSKVWDHHFDPSFDKAERLWTSSTTSQDKSQ